MKRLFGYIALLLLATATVVGCHGDVNELDTVKPTPDEQPGDGDGEDNDEDKLGLMLYVDKNSIEADGVDKVTFSLTQTTRDEKSGELVVEELMDDEKTLANVRIKHEKGDIKLERYATTFSAVKNGNYSFVATYKGVQSKNSVHVKARNRELYEPYGQKIAVYKLTGTWCGYCPLMTSALKNVSASLQPNMIVMALHNGDRWSVSTSGGGDLAAAMISRFGDATTGLPSCVYDFSYLSSERTPTGIDAILESHLRENPATCGVKISQALMLNGTLNFSASITSPAGGEYDLAYAVLLDNQYYEGGSATDNMYNDIVIAVSDNFLGMSDSRVTLSPNVEHTKRFSVKNLSAYDEKDLRVVVFAFSKRGGKTIIDNANVCAVGGSADYMAVEFVDGMPEGVTPDDGEQPVVPEGVLHLSADKTTIAADGTDGVTFSVMYGSTDVSNARTMNLIYTLNGEEVTLSSAANRFSTTVPGVYTFRARYYKAGDIFSENEVTITATAASQGDMRAFRHKLLGVQFTSVGCPNCPVLSTVIGKIQQEQPNRLVAVSFHLDYTISDPMKVPIAEHYYNALSPNGLPRFYLDLRVGETQMTSNKSHIESEMASTIANYPPTCGVAISSSYDAQSRRLTITPRICSATATAYRYLVFLVEDGIEHSQYGTTGTYTHNNVVRAVLSDNIYGVRFNGGATLTAGKDTALSTPLTTTLNSSWRPENMRIVVAALTSQDGGVTYHCNNTNECALGSNADYAYEGDTGDEGDTGGGDTGNVAEYNRHVAVFEFTGAWCSFCPSGYRSLKYLIEDYYSHDTVHILAFHDSTGGSDPMAIPLTATLSSAFAMGGYPAFLFDMRDKTSEKSELQALLDQAFKNYPAKCGVRLSSTCSADGKGSVETEIAASSADTYRIAIYIVEDGIVAPQNDNGLYNNTYVHDHVVRALVTSLYEGERVGTLAAGESKRVTHNFTLGEGWNAEKCSICALAIDGNGHVNNVAVCPVGGSCDFDYKK